MPIIPFVTGIRSPSKGWRGTINLPLPNKPGLKISGPSFLILRFNFDRAGLLSVPAKMRDMRVIFAVLAAAACFLACADAATTKEGMDFLEVRRQNEIQGSCKNGFAILNQWSCWSLLQQNAKKPGVVTLPSGEIICDD
jgi:hypothetical protein